MSENDKGLPSEPMSQEEGAASTFLIQRLILELLAVRDPGNEALRKMMHDYLEPGITVPNPSGAARVELENNPGVRFVIAQVEMLEGGAATSLQTPLVRNLALNLFEPGPAVIGKNRRRHRTFLSLSAGFVVNNQNEKIAGFTSYGLKGVVGHSPLPIRMGFRNSLDVVSQAFTSATGISLDVHRPKNPGR